MTLPGNKSSAKQLGDNPNPEDVWNLLFSAEIINEIIFHTNKKISELRKNYKDSSHPTLRDTDIVEMRGFLGLLIYTSAFKSGEESLESLYATDGTGRDVFRCTMPKRRFEFLLISLRFDNAETRIQRKALDLAAPISNVFQRLIENFQRHYNIGANATVDEMLIAYRGRCSFRMYMPRKPAKYGIKVQCLTDARNNYLYNAYIYTGRGSDGQTLSMQEKQLSIPTQSVIRLCKGLENSHRNITADNWFSSIQLVQELQKRGLTYVGTLKKNKAELPPQFLPHKTREVNSSLYGFHENITLLSHVPKKSRAVLVISSMHHTASKQLPGEKPEIIEYYNMTKSGVDTLDKKTAGYSSSRRTNRWPVAVFFQLLDISAVNAFIMHQSYKNAKQLERLDFLKELAKSLTTPQMERRLQNKKMPRELKSTLERILKKSNTTTEMEPAEEVLETRRLCHICPTKLKRKTQYLCCVCKKPICLKCSRKICLVCYQTL